jgi:phosphoglycolate phosphatase
MTVLLFDIDGTLLHAGGAGQAAMELALAEEFDRREKVHGIPTAGRTDRAISADLFAFHGLPLTDENIEKFKRAYFQRLPHALKNLGGAVLPGVPDLLSALSRDSHWLLGLLTGNFAEGAALKLRHFELNQHFGFGAYGDLHVERNDVATIAWSETQRLRPLAVPEQVWVIGDTPADIACGRTIGAKTLAVATGYYTLDQLKICEPDFLCADLADTEAILDVFRGALPKMAK